MKARHTYLVGLGFAALYLVLAAPAAWAHCGGKHGPSHPHCSGGGQEDPVFTADSLDPDIPPVNSFSLDGEDIIVFRNAQVDFTQFEGAWAGSGAPCNHGIRIGTFSLKPKSSQNPEVAVMTSYFQSELEETDDTTMHFFTLEGVFDDPSNWPPSAGNPTSMTFSYWELYAENKKARRADCAGESPSVSDPNGPWTITVTRQP